MAWIIVVATRKMSVVKKSPISLNFSGVWVSTSKDFGTTNQTNLANL
jgi:hypothetical protein